MDERQQRLMAPFAEVDWKVQATSKDKSKGQIVPYVDARSVAERLDEVLGFEGWHDSYSVLDAGEVKVVLCQLTVGGVTKEDVGEGDTLKAAFSDAFKRAAVKFGVGRYLYRMPQIWLPIEQGKFIPKEALKRLDDAYRRFVKTGEWRLEGEGAPAPRLAPQASQASANDIKAELIKLQQAGANLPKGWENISDPAALRRLYERYRAAV